jgi:hypothetical protein
MEDRTKKIGNKIIASFSPMGTAVYLKELMRSEPYEKFITEMKREAEKDYRDIVKVGNGAIEKLKTVFKKAGIKKVEDGFGRAYKPELARVFTSGKIEIGETEQAIIMMVSDKKVKFLLTVKYEMDGNASGCKLVSKTYKFLIFDGADAKESWGHLPSVNDLSRVMINAFEKDLFEQIHPEEFEENVLSINDVFDWVKDQKTWLEWELHDDVVYGSTRDHGRHNYDEDGEEVEEAGEEDIREAKRISGIIRKQYKDAVKIVVDTTDEWTNVDIRLNSHVRRSSETNRGVMKANDREAKIANRIVAWTKEDSNFAMRITKLMTDLDRIAGVNRVDIDDKISESEYDLLIDLKTLSKNEYGEDTSEEFSVDLKQVERDIKGMVKKQRLMELTKLVGPKKISKGYDRASYKLTVTMWSEYDAKD